MIHSRLKNVYCIDTLVAGMENFLSCFLIDDEKVVLSDPGPPCVVGEVMNSLKEIGKLDYIALSHVHVDHAGATALIAKEFRDAKIITHPKAARHIINPEKLWKSSLEALGKVADIYGEPEPVDADRIITVENGQRFNLGKEEMTVIYTPGHAVHHISFFLENSRVLLSGESIGMYLHGKLILTSPIPPLVRNDVMQTFDIIESLEPTKIAYCHFGFSEPDLLRVAREKTDLWIDVTKEVVEKGGDIDELNKKLIEKDRDYKYLTEFYKDNLVFSYPYRTVLNGLIYSAKNSGKNL
jgi:glyoxylase-like metal-dependent hydrolase (beta-lactamase superfamily II)